MGPSPLRQLYGIMSKFSLASDVNQANGGVRPSSLSCPGGSKKGVRKSKPVDTELMQRAGATGATAPESATATDLGKSTMDLEKDIEWLDTRGGGEYQIRIGRIKSVQEDQEHCLIPETPSPNAKMSGKGAKCSMSYRETTSSERMAGSPADIFRGRGLVRTPPDSQVLDPGPRESTSTKEGEDIREAEKVPEMTPTIAGGMEENESDMGPQTFKRLIQRELVVSIDRCRVADETAKRRSSSASRAEGTRRAFGITPFLQKREADNLVNLVPPPPPLMRGAKQWSL